MNALQLERFTAWTEKLSSLLDEIEYTDSQGKSLETDEAYLRLKSLTLKARTHNRQIFLIGNGASSSMASHIAADLCKNGQLATRCFTDASLLSAIANDCGVEELFAEPLRRQAHAGDILVCISSSGESPNIIQACKVAKEMGLTIVTLSAMGNKNRLRTYGDINFYVPAANYGFAETAHAAILHYWVDVIVETPED